MVIHIRLIVESPGLGGVSQETIQTGHHFPAFREIVPPLLNRRRKAAV